MPRVSVWKFYTSAEGRVQSQLALCQGVSSIRPLDGLAKANGASAGLTVQSRAQVGSLAGIIAGEDLMASGLQTSLGPLQLIWQTKCFNVQFL
jgi:hypothetical protein